MSSIGTGYDLGVDTFSPDGRLFQVEYATKAANNSGTALGVCCKDGVVVGLEKILLSKMLEKGSNHRCYAIDKQAGIATAGLNSDARQIAQRGRGECWDYRQNWGVPIDGKVLADRLSMFVHVYTCYWFVRPFGCSVLLASYAEDGPQLFMIDPAGSCWGYNACSVGKASAIAKTELEKLSTDITCEEAIKAIVRILYQVHDETKDKLWEAELYWVSDKNNRVFEPVPADLLNQAVTEAKASLEEKDA